MFQQFNYFRPDMPSRVHSANFSGRTMLIKLEKACAHVQRAFCSCIRGSVANMYVLLYTVVWKLGRGQRGHTHPEYPVGKRSLS